jgi:hypothetical protein
MTRIRWIGVIVFIDSLVVLLAPKPWPVISWLATIIAITWLAIGRRVRGEDL